MMSRAIATLTVVTFVVIATSFMALGSSLPPSHPGKALDLGVLDEIITTQGFPQRFNCRAYTTKLFFSHPHYNTRYYKFRISSAAANLTTKMRETPDATLWFHLLDKDRKFIREIKGGDDQLVTQRVDRGEYYLQLMTDGNASRNPDGSNLGEITFKAMPTLYDDDRDPSAPKNLGSLNSKIVEAGVLAVVQNRKFPHYVSQGQLESCPEMPGMERADFSDEFVFTAPKGNIYLGVFAKRVLNWPFQNGNPGLYLRRNNTWIRSTGSFLHAGGEVRIAVGYPEGNQIFGADAYVEYEITINRNVN